MEFAIQEATPSKRKKRTAKPAIPKEVSAEMKRYTAAYKALFKIAPEWTYRKPYICIGNEPGVNLKRLTQLTRMLRERCKDL